MSNDLFRFMRRVSTDDMADFIDRITLTPNSFGVFRQQKTAVVNDFMTTDFDFIYMLSGRPGSQRALESTSSLRAGACS